MDMKCTHVFIIIIDEMREIFPKPESMNTNFTTTELKPKEWKRSSRGTSVMTSHKIGEKQHKRKHRNFVADSLE